MLVFYGCTLGAAQAPLDNAERLYRAQEFAKAADAFKPLANAGNAQAQFRLGMLYHLGRGVREDESEAFRWILSAARQGHVDAQFQLATLYTFRYGVPADEPDPDVQAAHWYFAAASQGHAEAQYALGLMFLTGKGVARSTEEANKWMRRAAERGYDAARTFGSAPAATTPAPAPPR